MDVSSEESFFDWSTRAELPDKNVTGARLLGHVDVL